MDCWVVEKVLVVSIIGIKNWMMEDIEKSLGGKCTVKVGTGDRIVIKTPGGGGFGELLSGELNFPWRVRIQVS